MSELINLIPTLLDVTTLALQGHAIAERSITVSKFYEVMIVNLTILFPRSNLSTALTLALAVLPVPLATWMAGAADLIFWLPE